MFKPVTVSLSNPALSLLLYENRKCNFQQEGFLLGKIVHKETKTVTDGSTEQINISKAIQINGVLPCPTHSYFYNKIGKVDKKKLRSLLGHQTSKVVAWYKYQNSTMVPFTIRTKLIHKQLYDFLGISDDLFTICFLKNEQSDNFSTHTYTQSFVRFNMHECDQLPVHIAKLSDPNNLYKLSGPTSDIFKKTLDGLKMDAEMQGYAVINKIQNALLKKTQDVVKELGDVEATLHELEGEVLEAVKEVEFKQKCTNNYKNDNTITIDDDF